MATNKELAEEVKTLKAEKAELVKANEELAAENTRLGEELQSTLEHNDEVAKEYDAEIARLNEELKSIKAVNDEAPEVPAAPADNNTSAPVSGISKVAEFTHNVNGRAATVRVHPVAKGKKYAVYLEEVK